VFRFVCCTSAKRPDSRGPEAGEWRRRQVQSASEDWLLSCGETEVRREENVGALKAMRVHCHHSTMSTEYCCQPYSAWSLEPGDLVPQKSAFSGQWLQGQESKRQCLNLQKGWYADGAVENRQKSSNRLNLRRRTRRMQSWRV
jgi:hypothetical protein